MTKISLTIGLCTILGTTAVFAQQPTNAFPNKGWAGIGILSPKFDLQLYGQDIYYKDIGNGERIIGPNGPIKGDLGDLGGHGPIGDPSYNGPLLNFTTANGLKRVAFGPTSGILLTNTTTGSAITDGGILRMSEKHLYLDNYEEAGNISIANSSSNMLLHGATKRIFVGGLPINDYYHAKFSIESGNDNGLFVETTVGNKYGLSVRMFSDADNALQVISNTTAKKNFTVTGEGKVFARKYTTTMQNIPDYVFDENYPLLPMADLRAFLQREKHLPNVPSAEEYEANGVELGEMNRVLLEKVEELTLYILQLEERMKRLEEEKK